jgi:NAD(P)-dependent dehydrogenase (short-subunit alcohol dehydrogenase family)
MAEVKDKVALVTGASQGIGLAIAKKLAEHGAKVVLAARSEDAITERANEINKNGGQAIAVRTDVTDFDSVSSAVSKAIDAFGRLDVLVNNAGMIDPIARISESDPAIWSSAVDTNVKGVYFGLRAAIPVMERQGSGIIVNMSSGAANSALEGWSHYCSTKVAAKKLTECAHKEIGDRGIRVVGLSPGTVATDMMAKIKASGINPVSKLDWSVHIPPEWVGEAVVFLCGEGGTQFAGTDFSVKTPEGRQLVGLPVEGAPG